MKRTTATLILSAILLSACAGAATPTQAPDRVATRVAEELAIAATLTAAAPKPVATSQSEPTVTVAAVAVVPTATEQPTLEPTAPIAATATTAPTKKPVPTRRPNTATPKPLPTATPLPPPPTPTVEEEVYAVIGAGGSTNGLQGDVVLPRGQKGLIINDLTFKDRMNIRMRVWDPSVGGKDGDGIASVRFRIDNDNGDTVFDRKESNPAYCLFGGDGVNCTVFVFANEKFVWPQSDAPRTPIKNGNYRMNVDVFRKNGGNKGNWNFNFNITGVPDNSGSNNASQVVVEIVDPPANTVITDRFVFQARAFETGSGNNDGDGIANVKLQVFDSNNNLVHERTEGAKPYCAFQDTNDRCNEWFFSQHNKQWRNNAPATNGSHTLRATAFAKNGSSKTTEITINLQLP